jgi:CubicO group peptidase (beta-lactamase class C family)
MTSYDHLMRELLQKWRIPGASLAVVKNGRLVAARGYGYADQVAQQPVQPTSLFRIASLSKAITAAAILKLAETGKLSLDGYAFDILQDLKAPMGATADVRLSDITVRHLLQHTAGWDRDTSFDPMFKPVTVAQAMNEPAPASAKTTVRYMMGQPLQFKPGTQYSYSNFGYNILGRIIEQLSGQTYEQYVQEQILRPAGIKEMRIGRTRLKQRAANEVKYYALANESPVKSVFPEVREPVEHPYGGFYLEAMDAHGGWIASAVDLARFIAAIDGWPTRPDILKPDSIRTITARPAPPLKQDTATYYGFGWQIRPIGDNANWWHSGLLSGSQAFMVRTYHGYSWVVLFNSAPNEAEFMAEVDQGLWKALNAVTQWPEWDLFDFYQKQNAA